MFLNYLDSLFVGNDTFKFYSLPPKAIYVVLVKMLIKADKKFIVMPVVLIKFGVNYKQRYFELFVIEKNRLLSALECIN